MDNLRANARPLQIMPKTFPFLSLPPEIRNIIYAMVVLSPDPIGIWTPVIQQTWRRRCIWNRQTYHEASLFYFSLNTFKIGIDDYRFGKETIALDAFGRRSFVTNTPAYYLALVRKIIVEIQPLERPGEVDKSCLEKLLERVDELSIVARILKRSLKGLEILYLQHATKYPNGSPYGYQITQRFEGTATTKFIKALRILMGHQSLKAILARLDYALFDFEEQIEKRLLEKDPAAAALIKF